MAQAMPKTCFHCPICNEDFSTFTAFDSEDHKCCVFMHEHPGIAEKIISARCSWRDRERRVAARYLALYQTLEKL